ncbi:hypothetical protein CH35J_012859 [Colletotrichum higginsianum]|uniref:Uncharacterized protein n=1 Tax=Colletotrichum higginsianum TaxID=80884 RepID=A0A4T0VC47_9PEZI|nr:hypothetical protein CH35J_012859 [Colletotrichum higginsianum]
MPPPTLQQPQLSLTRRNDGGELVELQLLANMCSDGADDRRGPLIVAATRYKLRDALAKTMLFREHTGGHDGTGVTLHIHADMALRCDVQAKQATMATDNAVYFHAADLNVWYASLAKESPETRRMLVFITTADARNAGWLLPKPAQLPVVICISDDEEDDGHEVDNQGGPPVVVDLSRHSEDDSRPGSRHRPLQLE